jgi:hypothetical protein
MKPSNLITTCEGYEALTALGKDPEGPLKPHEIRTLLSFCNAMMKENCTLEDFDGYYIGYSIKQIGKEFDLLKFTEQGILNIELKADLLIEDKEEKILHQMRTNHYYLNAVTSAITIFTYVENDGAYLYHPDQDCFEKVPNAFVADSIKKAVEDLSFDPDQKFIPANYLISPFNQTSQEFPLL